MRTVFYDETKWKLVPAAPTKEMLNAAEAVTWRDADTRGSCINQWNVMLAVAPTPPAVEPPTITITESGGVQLNTSSPKVINKLWALVDQFRDARKEQP